MNIWEALARAAEEPQNKPKPQPNVLVVVQARLGSTRLPGKVLLPLGGKPVLQWVVERAQRAGYPVCVTVPNNEHTLSLWRSVEPLGCNIHAPKRPEDWGPIAEEDVLSRFAATVDSTRPTPDLVVRITADCPCLDPTLIQRAVQAITWGHDYAANTVERTYPRGLDVEAFTTEQLFRTHRQAKRPYDREHVTPFMQVSANRPYVLRKGPQEPAGLSERWRWCLDTPEDYAWLSGAFNALGDPTTVALADYSLHHPPPLD